MTIDSSQEFTKVVMHYKTLGKQKNVYNWDLQFTFSFLEIVHGIPKWESLFARTNTETPQFKIWRIH